VSTKAKILILDDEPIVGERLKASLERVGFAVDAFSSSQEALQRLKEEYYDILVTDLKMSGPDGMEVLRTARRVRPGIKSVVITGFATIETAEEARQSGAVEFIAKPFRISQLKSLLMSLVGSEESTDE
jgi:two-component system response regulator PilR (NtrC family)